MSERAIQLVSIDALQEQRKVRASFPGYASGTHKSPSKVVPQVCLTYPHRRAQPQLTTLSRLPAHVSLESAALLEPLSVAIHAIRRATVEQGDTAIIFGAGTVGLLTAAMAKMSGATTVVIVDVDHGRIEYALSNGFAHKGFVVPSRNNTGVGSDQFSSAKELATDVMQVASLNDDDFEGADVTFDCTGKEICMQAGLFVSASSAICQSTSNTGQGNKTRW
jgi:L-iditol 2-dehydrogenase